MDHYDELRVLRDGWLDGTGRAPQSEGLEWLINWFKSHLLPSSLTPPYLYPTPEGGVQAEWSLNGFEVSLEIDLDQHIAMWHSMDMSTDEDEERKLNMDCHEDAKWIIKRLLEMNE